MLQLTTVMFFCRIEGSLGKVVARDVKNNKRTVDEGKAYFTEVMGRIRTTTNLAEAHDCDLIVEAIAENRDLKMQFYKALGPQIKPECIFASNTSSLQITEMAMASNRPEKFVGLHFFNPVQMMKLGMFAIDVHCCVRADCICVCVLCS